MAHSSSSHGWQHRSPQLQHPASMPMEQQSFSQTHGLSAQPGYPANVGYPQHHHSASQGYYQTGPPPSQYLYSQQSGHPQSRSHPRSAPGPYPFPNNSSVPTSSPPMQDHLFTSPPPSYLVNQQSEYYLAQGSSMPSNSPQPQPLMSSGTVYSSPESAPGTTETDHQVRVISIRPKPKCWEHGCNGREFSTFSNLLRHQREKSGVVAKAECPSCGAVFTRTTARNIHVAQGKCKALGRDGGH